MFDHFKVRVNNSMVNASVSAHWKAYGWVAVTQKQSFGAKVCFSAQTWTVFWGLRRNLQYQQRSGRCDNHHHIYREIWSSLLPWSIFDIILYIKNHFDITMTLPILVDKAVAWSLLWQVVARTSCLAARNHGSRALVLVWKLNIVGLDSDCDNNDQTLIKILPRVFSCSCTPMRRTSIPASRESKFEDLSFLVDSRARNQLRLS